MAIEDWYREPEPEPSPHRRRPLKGHEHPEPDPGPEPMSFRLLDAHCHLDHMQNADALAGEMADRGIGICCATVTPSEYEAARDRFADRSNVCMGAGLHPWWLADGRCDGDDVDRLVLDLHDVTFVGEVGLDFSEGRDATRSLQLAAFEDIVRTCAEHPRRGRVLSLHAVQSATDALDILERYSMAGGALCIFHWFSGTSDELVRARKLGCYFSVNERMLKTKRGREYVRILEEDRLLLETDAPPVFDEPYTADEWERALTSTVETMATIRNQPPKLLQERIAATSNRLFATCFS